MKRKSKSEKENHKKNVFLKRRELRTLKRLSTSKSSERKVIIKIGKYPLELATRPSQVNLAGPMSLDVVSVVCPASLFCPHLAIDLLAYPQGQAHDLDCADHSISPPWL